METIQPSSPGEPSHEGSQNPMDSPPSTIPLDEPQFRDTESTAGSIIVLDDDDDQTAASTSRPRRANKRPLDYSYRDYEQLMEAVAARNPPRRRKRQKNADTLSLESTLEQFSQDVRDQGQAWIQEIKDLRYALRSLYERREDLEEKLRASEEKTQKLQRALDERKSLQYLQCQICYKSKEYWRVLGCGHVYCTTCISDMNTAEPLFNSNCPCCRERIVSCKALYPELVEHQI
ncbi:hypothetical protein UA08_09473 [Talaromyces atroroseus]|uniref:RING-type domain-containing protein n=1 Tax=Talaromyces atroroseus TaxID=1441469 RepID=A0A1Q5Q609_TALAT|nr:hypothetical protein UA08_09473 [Talaromyces atroroseus]OKL55247.1 hypothetical protein UA08_09473 [Talaromyces atroroseus]